MLRAGKVGLRARDEADIAVLHAELYEDIATYMIADSRPWRPIPAGSPASPYAVGEPGDDVALFSVVELARGELAGANWPARPCCGPSTCTTGRLTSGCRCGRRSAGAAWARTWSWRCASTASPSAACTGCRSTRWPATRR